MFDLPSWLTDWLKTVSLWDVVLWVLGALAVIFFFRKGWPALRRFATAFLNFAKMVDAVAGLPAFITRTDATLTAQDKRIAEIHHETHRNDGSSIKDSSERTEEAVSRVEIGVKGLYDRVGSIDEQLTDLRTADADMRRDFENTKPHPPQGDTES